MKHYTPMYEDDMSCVEDAGLEKLPGTIYYLATDVDARIAELEKCEHLCRLALTSLDQGQSVQFGSAWHEQLRSLMGT